MQRHHQELLYLFQTLLNKSSPPIPFACWHTFYIFLTVTRQTFIDISRTVFHMSLLVIYTISTGQMQNIFLINLKEYPKFYNHVSMKSINQFIHKHIYTQIIRWLCEHMAESLECLYFDYENLLKVDLSGG